MARTAILTV